MKAVRHHAEAPWVLLYIERWLRAPVQRQDGSQEERTKGSPQGSVVSPLLANLFMHYAFDLWMRRTYPDIRFERYADDVIIHAKSQAQAEQVLEAVRRRLTECRLELHPEKTKIVYCQDDDRRGQHEHIKFDFLGYTFRPRRAKNRRGKFFVSFLPAISNKAAKAIRETIRDWRLAATRNNQSLEEIAGLVNPSVRGWVNYYGRFYRSALTPVLRHLERALVNGHAEIQTVEAVTPPTQPTGWVGWRDATRTCSSSGRSGFDRRLDHKSRMRREPPVRYPRGPGGEIPPGHSTRDHGHIGPEFRGHHTQFTGQDHGFRSPRECR